MEGCVVRGVGVGGGGGGGGGGPGRCCSCSIPNPAPTVSFGVCNQVRFFLLLLYLHMRRGRKGSFFQSPFDNFRENRNRSFYNFPTTCRKRISIIRVRKVLFSPWSYHKFNNILFINVCFSVWK